MMENFWVSPGFGILIFAVGLCVGSFLNVLIHRMPREISVNKPRRSFCPACKKMIAWHHNLPVISWLVLRGKCPHCKVSIAVRYLMVELLTGAMFFLMWWQFNAHPGLAIFYIVLCSLLMVVVFVDIEHLIVPMPVIWIGGIAGLLAGAFLPWRLDAEGWQSGLLASLSGLAVGFLLLWFVVLFGKMAFGKKKLEFENAKEWKLEESDDELLFVLDGESHGWSDLFYRKNDKLIIEGSGFLLDGDALNANSLTITEDQVLLDGKKHLIEEINSLEGQAEKVIIPREAMGMGDVYLLAMLGACLGWQAAVFIFFVSSLISILIAVLGRMGFGQRLPYGPSLALAAVVWIFWGRPIWDWYFAFLGS